MDYKEITGNRRKWFYILASSILILILTLAFPILQWKEFSPELIHRVGHAPSDTYYLFSETVHGSYIILISAIALVISSVLVFYKTKNGNNAILGLRIAYLIPCIIYIIAMIGSGGDYNTSTFGPTFTSWLAAIMAIIGCVIMIRDTYKIINNLTNQQH